MTLDSIRVSFGFSACFLVDCIGHNGGLTLLWDIDSLNVNIVSCSSDHIDGHISDLALKILAFHGFLRQFIDKPKTSFLAPSQAVYLLPPMVVWGGDFNEILYHSEKIGLERSNKQLTLFRTSHTECSLGFRFFWNTLSMV